MNHWPLQDLNSVESQPKTVQFSAFVTVCLGMIFLVCLGFLTFAHLSMPRLERIPAPARALEIVTNQVLGLRDGINGVSAIEQRVMGIMGEKGGELQQVLDWYRELVETDSDPLSALYLGILEGEAGLIQNVTMKTHMWKDWAMPFPLYGQILQAAYGQDHIDLVTAKALQAQLAEHVPSGWFYRQMGLRIAEQSGDETLEAMFKADIQRHASRLVWNNRILSGLQMMAVVTGMMALFVLWRRWKWGGRQALRVGGVVLPPAWKGMNGVVVLVRGAGIASLFIIALSMTRLHSSSLQFLIPFSIHLPIIALAYVYLWRPLNLSVKQALGMDVVPGGWRVVILFSLGLFAMGAGGGWLIGMVAQTFHASLHWTDWFDPTMIQGTMWQVLPSLLSYTILAPLFEELVFRGVLYSTLRRRFNAPASMVVSALIFSVAHGYGAFGFVTIFWSGVLWAWAYEQSGSVLPGIVAHALNNSMVCMAVLFLVRPA